MYLSIQLSFPQQWHGGDLPCVLYQITPCGLRNGGRNRDREKTKEIDENLASW